MVRWTYPLNAVVLVPFPNLLYFNDVSTSKVPQGAAAPLPTSCPCCIWSLVYMCGLGRCPSSGLVCNLLPRGRRGLRLKVHCQRSISFHNHDMLHNHDMHCLEDTGALWCLSYPSGGAPFLLVLCFLVVRETWLLGLVSPSMRISKSINSSYNLCTVFCYRTSAIFFVINFFQHPGTFLLTTELSG